MVKLSKALASLSEDLEKNAITPRRTPVKRDLQLSEALPAVYLLEAGRQAGISSC